MTGRIVLPAGMNTRAWSKARDEYLYTLDSKPDLSDMIFLWRKHPLLFMNIEAGLELSDRWQVDFWLSFCDLSVTDKIILLLAATGVGKTAAMAGTVLFSMSCLKSPREGLKGMCASLSERNLMKNFWQEIGKHLDNSSFLKHYFSWKEPYELRPKSKSEQGNWFVSPQIISKSATPDMQGESIRGIHSDNTFLWLDECQGIPILAGQKIHGVFTAGNLKFGRVIMSGNPTSKLGMLYDFYKSGMAQVIKIHGDPRLPDCSSRVNQKYNSKLIEKHKEDSFIVRTSVRGLFPLQEMNSLIDGEKIMEAVRRNLAPKDYGSADIRMGVDVARGTEGGDKSVIVVRQGRKVLHIEKHQTLKEEFLAAQVKRVKSKFKTTREFIDITGGYGETTLLILKKLGVYSAVGISFGKKALKEHAYANKRAEMWWELKGAIEDEKHPLDLPEDDNLIQELESMLYKFDKKDRILMFSKELLIAIIGRSPDTSDALCLTYANVDGKNEESVVFNRRRKRRKYRRKGRGENLRRPQRRVA